jgi:hypothetical protein
MTREEITELLKENTDLELQPSLAKMMLKFAALGYLALILIIIIILLS